MTLLFYASSLIALFCALMVVTRSNAMHALIYLVVLFLAIASVFFALGAPFVAALQIVIYAGAIMVLFVFVVMMLNLGHRAEERERAWMAGYVWVLPVFLALVLAALFAVALAHGPAGRTGAAVTPKTVGIALFTDYFVGVELASVLLLAGLVAAFHFGVIPSRLEVGDEPDTD